MWRSMVMQILAIYLLPGRGLASLGHVCLKAPGVTATLHSQKVKHSMGMFSVEEPGCHTAVTKNLA